MIVSLPEEIFWLCWKYFGKNVGEVFLTYHDWVMRGSKKWMSRQDHTLRAFNSIEYMNVSRVVVFAWQTVYLSWTPPLILWTEGERESAKRCRSFSLCRWWIDHLRFSLSPRRCRYWLSRERDVNINQWEMIDSLLLFDWKRKHKWAVSIKGSGEKT